MEEQRDQSEDDSVSLSPSLPSPPLLPLQAAHHTHRTTNFFIDNILRPDFGCKRERCPAVPSTPCPDSSCSTDSVSSSASSTVSSPASRRHSKAAEADRGNAAKSGVVSAPSVALNSPGEAPSPSKGTRELMWPAWVYCTRYSDRPSSGKASASFSLIINVRYLQDNYKRTNIAQCIYLSLRNGQNNRF
uniref:Engrailed homeobox 1b n=1 Tax=Sinocyclocheilus grahami TaxID=75366 RepID=A0A672T3V5_SINGR